MLRHDVAGRLAIGLATLTLVAGCAGGATPTETSASPSLAPVTPDAATTQPEPTPILPPTAAPGVPGGAGLVVRLTWVSDVMVSIPGTTILDDGRVIWAGGEEGNRLVQRRLTEVGLDWVRTRLDETGLLAANRSYGATLKPGAEPDARGVTSYAFQLERDGTRVKVDSGNPADYTPPAAWVVGPEMQVLTDLAGGLQAPEAWIDPSMWAGPSEPFEAGAYMVIVDTESGTPAFGHYPADAGEVAWPFAGPITQVGAPFLRGGQIAEHQRCLVVTAEVARSMADAEAAAVPGRVRDLGAWMTDLGYTVSEGTRSITVTTQPLLPYQTPGCTEALAW